MPRPKGWKHTDESKKKIGDGNRGRKGYAKHSSTPPSDYQSSSGYAGEQDYSTLSHHRGGHSLWEERGYSNQHYWWGYDD